MGQLGVHFAIDAATAQRLLAAGDDESVMTIIEEIEEEMVDVYDCGTDKAWDAIHRSLTDGFLGYENGESAIHEACIDVRWISSLVTRARLLGSR